MKMIHKEKNKQRNTWVKLTPRLPPHQKKTNTKGNLKIVFQPSTFSGINLFPLTRTSPPTFLDPFNHLTSCDVASSAWRAKVMGIKTGHCFSGGGNQQKVATQKEKHKLGDTMIILLGLVSFLCLLSRSCVFATIFFRRKIYPPMLSPVTYFGGRTKLHGGWDVSFPYQSFSPAKIQDIPWHTMAKIQRQIAIQFGCIPMPLIVKTNFYLHYQSQQRAGFLYVARHT